MKFGEKVRELRKKCGMTQAELAKKAGLGLKTITNYEGGSTYPQNREVYATLAEILGCEADYLRSENEEFIAMAQREYGYRGKKGAEKLVEELTAKVRESKGDTVFRISLFDPANNVSSRFFSKSHKVSLSSSLINYLDENNIRYSIS